MCVVVDGVNDDLHQMYPQGLDLWLCVEQDRQRKRNELRDVVGDMATHVEHDNLSKLTAADSVNASNHVVFEDGSDHLHERFEIGAVLDQHLGTVVGMVLSSPSLPGTVCCVRLITAHLADSFEATRRIPISGL